MERSSASQAQVSEQRTVSSPYHTTDRQDLGVFSLNNGDHRSDQAQEIYNQHEAGERFVVFDNFGTDDFQPVVIPDIHYWPVRPRSSLSGPALACPIQYCPARSRTGLVRSRTSLSGPRRACPVQDELVRSRTNHSGPGLTIPVKDEPIWSSTGLTDPRIACQVQEYPVRSSTGLYCSGLASPKNQPTSCMSRDAVADLRLFSSGLFSNLEGTTDTCCREQSFCDTAAQMAMTAIACSMRLLVLPFERPYIYGRCFFGNIGRSALWSSCNRNHSDECAVEFEQIQTSLFQFDF
ncbi:unnamed protein product [Nesidiocoris tenuis]|uniref:Uncharacterized protein n=1 Tax=Nesidiocoris tenuis TaxID=355587 RepID=A0A6H5G7A8_9HEMI|nr:unnamed protein product [Nesidiocoris tenuis]